MGNIPVKKILKELGKLNEYHYPTEKCDLFLLPNGRLVGNDTNGSSKHVGKNSKKKD